MTHTYRHTALELYMDVMPLLADAGKLIRAHQKSLANQLDSAAQSVAANLSEGDTPCAGNSRSRVETAFGSLRETRIHLKTAVIYGYLPEDLYDQAEALLDRVTAMTWRRIQARRRKG